MSANEELPDNHLIAERRTKLERLRERGPAYPNDFRRDATAEELHLAYGDRPPEWLDRHPTRVTVAGRMMFKRLMGKASFAKLKDHSGLIQLFLAGRARRRPGLQGTTSATSQWRQVSSSRPGRELSIKVDSCGCWPSRVRCRTAAGSPTRSCATGATST
jgi:lysyl-tRNA synthetase class II